MSGISNYQPAHAPSLFARTIGTVRSFLLLLKKALRAVLLNQAAPIASCIFHLYVLFAIVGIFAPLFRHYVALNPFQAVRWHHYLFFLVPRGVAASLFASSIALFHGTRIEEQFGSCFFLAMILSQFALTNACIITLCHVGLFPHVNTLSTYQTMFSSYGLEHIAMSIFLCNSLISSAPHLYIFGIPRAIHISLAIAIVLLVYGLVYTAIPLMLCIAICTTLLLWPVYASTDFVRLTNSAFAGILTRIFTKSNVQAYLKHNNIPLAPGYAHMVPLENTEKFGHILTSRGEAVRDATMLKSVPVTVSHRYSILKPPSSSAESLKKSRVAEKSPSEDSTTDDIVSTPTESTKLTSSAPNSSSSTPPYHQTIMDGDTNLSALDTDGQKNIRILNTSSGLAVPSDSSGDDDQWNESQELLSSRRQTTLSSYHICSKPRNTCHQSCSLLQSKPPHVFQPTTVTFVDCSNLTLAPEISPSLDEILYSDPQASNIAVDLPTPPTLNAIYPQMASFEQTENESHHTHVDVRMNI